MKMARVIGRVWATSKHADLDHRTILLVRPVDVSGSAAGEAYLAIDGVGTGAGEHVLVVDEGGSAGQVLALNDPPIRTVIVGVIDAVTMTSPR